MGMRGKLTLGGGQMSFTISDDLTISIARGDYWYELPDVLPSAFDIAGNLLWGPDGWTPQPDNWSFGWRDVSRDNVSPDTDKIATDIVVDAIRNWARTARRRARLLELVEASKLYQRSRIGALERQLEFYPPVDEQALQQARTLHAELDESDRQLRIELDELTRAYHAARTELLNKQSELHERRAQTPDLQYQAQRRESLYEDLARLRATQGLDAEQVLAVLSGRPQMSAAAVPALALPGVGLADLD